MSAPSSISENYVNNSLPTLSSNIHDDDKATLNISSNTPYLSHYQKLALLVFLDCCNGLSWSLIILFMQSKPPCKKLFIDDLSIDLYWGAIFTTLAFTTILGLKDLSDVVFYRGWALFCTWLGSTAVKTLTTYIIIISLFRIIILKV